MNQIQKDISFIRYFEIADITIKVSSDLPITETTFHPKFKRFQTTGPEKDMIEIHHHFSLPDLKNQDLGQMVYNRSPWKIYKKDHQWTYVGLYPESNQDKVFKIAYFNHNHTQSRIFHESEDLFTSGNRTSLTLFPSDQILLARMLPDRNACILHSAGLVYRGAGLVFVGHSEAGKSTMVKMFQNKAEILCDDRNIVRKNSDGFTVYGTWSHGDVPDISANKARLKAIFFLNKSKHNRIEPLNDKKESIIRLLDCSVKPLVTPDWWDKIISLAYHMSQEIPCYDLYFNKQGGITGHISELL
ncbi:MAG: hypothetical protein GF421_11750 [Candidatus Aminicenantes bacterium]|nr:hypothetical protein [Candidatus Aminicenantes bacterium]